VTTAGSLFVVDNPALTSLAGLSGLTSVSETMWITNDPLVPTCEANALVSRLGWTCTGDVLSCSLSPCALCSGLDGTGTCP
jgi:hypothetical protein